MPKVEMSVDGYGELAEGGEELVLRIIPELNGSGLRAFDGSAPATYSLEAAEVLPDGSVELRYRPNGLDGREPV